MRKIKLKAIELFAGSGGMCLGLQQAGLDVVAAVEIDNWCCKTLEANKAKAFSKMKIIQEDITKLKGKDLLNKAGLSKGQLDVLSGGPPCQGFSYANSKRSTTDPRSKLMWQFIRMVREIQPRYFVIENVRGLLSFKDFFRSLLTDLEKCGYLVRFNVMDACNYGVPQHRVRVFIDGARKDLNIVPAFPVPTHFDLDKKSEKNNFIPASLVAQKCFAEHGFAKDEIEDIWFNTKLEITMNRKTATERIDQAIREILWEVCFHQINKIDDRLRTTNKILMKKGF